MFALSFEKTPTTSTLMSWNNMIRVAILDLYEGHANQGMRCIREILNQWADANQLDMEYDEFNVRQEIALPDTSYDIYISSGGPGSPLESTGTPWENAFNNWLQTMLDWNSNAANADKKHVFFICHSFQLACKYFKLGNVSKRISTAFGVFPIHMLPSGGDEEVFAGLKDPFYAVDSRDYQVITPDWNVIDAMGATVLAIEKERPYVPYERAMMSIRFNEFMIGTQFHPEADAFGMSIHLQTEERKKVVIDNHGEQKWKDMLDQLQDPEKILFTYSHILPNFLNAAVGVGVE
jgi:homoserine O-succinyltransferase/O-acetyltransferase